MKNRRHGLSIGEIMRDRDLIDAALRRATRQALRRHKLAGVPIAVSRDGKTVQIPAAEIEIPAEEPPRRRRKG